MRHFLLPPSQSLRLPEMQRKRTTEGKSTGEEEKRSGEVAGGAPQLADDDRSCKSPAIADVIDECKPCRRAGAGQNRGWLRPERADGCIDAECGERQRQHDEEKRSGMGAHTKAAPERNSGSATCKICSPVRSEWRPAITMPTAAME